MLKKSKRTLSLVLALIMICSAMSIMAFAADGGESVILTGTLSKRITLTTTSDIGIEHVSYITVNVSGYCYPEEGYVVWTQFNYSFSGELAAHFSVTGTPSNGMTRTINICFEENNDDPVHIYNVVVSVNADGQVSMSLKAV